MGLMRNHPVIDLKRKQRDGNRKNIGHQRAEHDLAHLAAILRKLSPEPMRRVELRCMASRHLRQRCPCPQGQAFEIGLKLFQRHFGAVVGAGGVIYEQRVVILFKHQNALTALHHGKGRPDLGGESFGFAEFGLEPGGAQRLGDTLGRCVALGVLPQECCDVAGLGLRPF